MRTRIDGILGALALSALLVGAGGSGAQAGEITVAAAADLNFAFKDLAAEYEQITGDQVKLSFGSSGNFFLLISTGARFDLFFSANTAYPKKLVEAGRADPKSLYSYATGRIVLWVPKGSPIDVRYMGMKALQHSSVKKIAIANPKQAPYGQSAVAAMEHYKIYDAVKNKLLLGENIVQTAHFVQSGSAEIGVLAMSLAVSPVIKPLGNFYEVPQEAYPAIEQGAVILKSAKNPKGAQDFLEFVKGPVGAAVLKRYGFLLPEKPPS
jgi:molybdate transport system substrate-binding protein